MRVKKQKAKKPVTKQKNTIILSEVEKLRYSEAVAVREMLKAMFESVNAQYELKLMELDVDGSLAKMAEEARKLQKAFQDQTTKINELSEDLGKTHNIDVSQYELDMETGTLKKKGKTNG